MNRTISASAGDYTISVCVALLVLCTIPFCVALGQEETTVAKVMDYELSYLEKEFVSLAEAMPAEKYAFAPKDGAFEGVRTFAQQVSHTAVNMYSAAAAVLGETLPPELAGKEYGPARLKTKEDQITYLKGSFAYTHKALATLTTANLTDEVDAWWGKAPRLFMADLSLWHTYDHYGQMVVYVRMNGIVPPASRPKPK